MSNRKTSNRQNWQIFLFFFLLLAILIEPVASTNDGSRLATVEALSEIHSFAIDNSRYAWTMDKYFYQGHFYSEKPPILAIYSSWQFLSKLVNSYTKIIV